MNMDFRHVMKFGNNSSWGWVDGSEIIVGGALTVGATVVLATATGGGALVVAAAVIVGGVTAADSVDFYLHVSNFVQTLTESHDPVPPPKQPVRPTPPLKGEPIELAPNQIITSISRGGQLLGKGPGKLILSGKYDKVGGNAEGDIIISKN